MKIIITTKTFKRSLLIIGFIFGISFSNGGSSFAQTWQWAVSGAGSAADFSGSSCVDVSGNLITTGTFYSNPLQMGTVTLNNSGSSGSDAYVAKLSPGGAVIWANKIGGPNNESITGVSTDASGNIYVLGYYNSAFLTVAPLSVSNFTNNLTYDIFVACYNSAGLIQWFKSYGGAKDEQTGGCVYSNSLSCLYIAGNFYSPSFTAGTNTVTNSDVTGNNPDIFLAKLTNTVVNWAKATGSSTSQDRASKMAIDSNSDPYFIGTIAPNSNTTVIGVTTLTTYGGQDIVFAKYNSSGTPVWSKNVGGSINCTCDFAGGIGVDASNNVFLSGTYSGASLVAGTFTLINSGGYDCFAAKTNSLGVFQWVNKVGGSGDQYSNDVTNDVNGNVFITGSFSGTNIVVGTTTLTNSTPGINTEIYVIKYNNAGVTQWGISAAGANNDEQGNDLSCDAGGNVYVTGNIYTSPTVFGTSTITSTGVNDVFAARISCLTNTISGLTSVCQGSSATLTATGATTYTWSTGAIGSSIVITPTANATYSLIGASGACSNTSTPFSVTFLPASLNTGSNLNLLCSVPQSINVTTNPSTPTLVVWSPTIGLSSSSILTPTVTAPSASTQYTVTANLTNGCVASGTLLVTQYAQKPDICLATVDTLGFNNEIFWDKTLYTSVDSFIVYREVSTNVYKRITATSVNAYSGFTDTVRSVGPANGDPNTTSYKYKLQIRDLCGNYSALSYWHQTIFIQDQQNGNFNWNSYAIESSATPVSVYDLFRIDLATNTYTLVTSTTGGLATDPQYNAFQTSAKWRVQANGFNCNPTNRINGTLNQKIKTKSNIKNDRLVGIKNYELMNSLISTYPSPAKDVVFIDGRALANVDLEIEMQNTLGQTIFSKKYTSSEKYQIETAAFANGVYFINIKQQNKTIAVKKIVISK